MSKIPTNRLSLSPSKPVLRQRRISTDSQQINSIASDPSGTPFRLADRVTTGGKSGTVAYIGRTQFAEGEWIGIILDGAQGKNDGSYNGVHYFETDANRGLFCRPDKVQHLGLNGTSQRASVYNPSRISIIADQINTVSEHPATRTLDPSSIKDLQIGDHVSIRGTKYGTLKYIGKIHVNEGIWCGIKLDGPMGKHNGKIEGVRYFRCQHRFGIFAPLRHVEKIFVDSKESRALARRSIISTGSCNRFRDSSSADSNLSELSTSSNSLNHFQPRSPTKTRQSAFSTDLATREASLSAQISKLLEKIKEKDMFIEQLQQRNGRDRSDLSHTTEKMNEMEINILALQHQYDLKENENEHLTKAQLELQHRLEDLQFQLEEHQYPDSDQNHLTIPHDHRLFSPEEIFIYEKTKDKITELQSVNKNLLHENQIFQEELKRHNELIEKEKLTNKFIEELKKQIELLKSQLTDLQMKEQSKTLQFTDNEAFYKQQIQEYQLQIDQITREAQNVQLRLATLEQEKQKNDKKINDLLSELKRHRESIVPDLEKQCQTLKLELQNQDRTAKIELNKKETYYQQQIKQYQEDINHAIYETDQVRSELKHIQEDNDLKESEKAALINELRSNYEKVQTELTELNYRENQVNMTASQRESLYEQQIKEYEENLNRATRQTENIQAEFAKLEEDKVLHEQKSNNIVHTLKQDYERQYETLKTQLVELQDQDNTQDMLSSERIARYEIEIKEHQMKIDQDAREIENLRSELTRIQEEKTTDENQLKQTIHTLQQDLSKVQTELNDREHKANLTINEHELESKQQIEEYKNNLKQARQQIDTLQRQLEDLQKEKTANKQQESETINKLKDDYERLKTDVQNRDQTQNMALNEREIHYQSQIKEYQTHRDQSLLEIQDLQTKLTQLQEERTSQETQLTESINQLKVDHEVQYKELQTELDELNERELKAHKELHRREAQFDQQITEYQDRLEQANDKIQHIQAELVKVREEKMTSNETINALQHDLDTLRSELQNQGQTQNMALNEREAHYQSQIEDHRTKGEQSLLALQSLQSEVTKLQEEKAVTENELNKTIDKLQQDFDKLQSELNEREHKEKMVLKQRESEHNQEVDEYQKNLELAIIENQNIQSELADLREEKETNEKNLNDMMNSLTEDFEKQIELFKTQQIALQEHYDATQKEQQTREYQTKLEQTIELNETKDELIQRTEDLTTINAVLKGELEELRKQNEQLLQNTNNQKTAEDSVVGDQLTKQVNDLQQMYTDLLEKQTNMEQKYAEEKDAQEKMAKERIGEYEMKIALMKSEYMVDMENAKLDHDQEVLRLRTQLQQATTPVKPKGKK